MQPAHDTFGKRLRLWREQRGYSQTRLREIIQEQNGISIGQNYISELETGKAVNPTLKVAVALAKVLNVSLDYFFLLVDDARPIDYDPEPEYISPEADEIAKMVDELPVEQRKAMLNYVSSFFFLEKKRLESTQEDFLLQSIQKESRRKAWPTATDNS